MSVSTQQTKSHSTKGLLHFASSSTRISLSLLGGGLAWTFHLLSSTVLSEWGSVAGLDLRSFLGINLIAWAVIAVTGLSLLVALWALWETIRMLGHYRQLVARQKSGESAHTTGAPFQSTTGAYLMAVGVCSNCVFLLVILAQALPIFFFGGAS